MVVHTRTPWVSEWSRASCLGWTYSLSGNRQTNKKPSWIPDPWSGTTFEGAAPCIDRQISILWGVVHVWISIRQVSGNPRWSLRCLPNMNWLVSVGRQLASGEKMWRGTQYVKPSWTFPWGVWLSCEVQRRSQGERLQQGTPSTFQDLPHSRQLEYIFVPFNIAPHFHFHQSYSAPQKLVQANLLQGWIAIHLASYYCSLALNSPRSVSDLQPWENLDTYPASPHTSFQ